MARVLSRKPGFRFVVDHLQRDLRPRPELQAVISKGWNEVKAAKY